MLFFNCAAVLRAATSALDLYTNKGLPENNRGHRMSNLDEARTQLATANRILAREGVLTVRKPGSKGAVHDHGHSWTLYGLVDGIERIERYTRLDDGKREGFADLKLVGEREMGPGGVDFVAPHQVHAERGGEARSVAIIIRGERMVGRFKQHIFDVEKKSVVDGWGPEQVPYALA